jgi:hypothetical protein
MATKTFLWTLDGSSSDALTGPSLSTLFASGVSIHRVRAKKSSSGGSFKFNLECSADKSGMYAGVELMHDFNPINLVNELTDGDDLVDIPNSITGVSNVSDVGNEPEWVDNGDFISGPTVDFLTGGGDRRVVLGAPVPSFAAGEPFSIAVVIDNGNNSNRPFVGSDVGSGTYASMYGNAGSRNMKMQDESGNVIQTASNSSTNFKNKDIHTAVRLSNNRVSCWRRGGKIIDASALSGTFSPSVIGNAQEGSSWNGQQANITRVLISDYDWTDTDREDVEAWLAWEYGLQTSGNSYLPSTHYGYQSDPRSSKTQALTADADLSSLGADTWSGYYAVSTTTISGQVDVFVKEAYKAGEVTIEFTVSY